MYCKGTPVDCRPGEFGDLMADVIELLGTECAMWDKAKPSHKRDGRARYDALCSLWADQVVISENTPTKEFKEIPPVVEE